MYQTHAIDTLFDPQPEKKDIEVVQKSIINDE
jgi:hypothetical protein